MKTWKRTLAILSLVVGLLFVAAPLTVEATAPNPKKQACEGAGGTWNASGSGGTCNTPGTGLETNIQNIVNLLFFVIGTIAVIVIIVGGIKFITADGDASKVKGARETIMYAVVGLVVAIMAYAIVFFVVDRFA